MEVIEKRILEEYEKDYGIASSSYEIMGLMLNDRYVEERLKLFNIENLYIYGGTYMAVQLYRVGKSYVNIKGIVDKSGSLVLDVQIPVLNLNEFQIKYNGEKVIITSIRFFREIREELQQFVNIRNILGIGEFMVGIK